MNSVSLVNLHNCTALVLDQNVTLLMGLNRSELLQVLKEALDRSLQRELLRDALSDCLHTNQQRPFDLPWWQKLVWSLVYAIILMVATGGNIIVMWIVLAHRRMRTVTNYFLVNLSVADLMMSVLNCVFNFIFMLNSDWPFGSVYCTISNFVANVTVASSVFTLVVTSFDRYNSGNTRIVCYMQWPDGSYPNSKTEYIYNLVFLGVTYLIPMMVMAVCYTLMGRKLWGSKSIGEHTQYQKESMKSKRKVVKMFIIVVTIFAVCWLPYHGFFIFAYHHRRFAETSYAQHVFLSFYWLAMSNAMVNPIIYYWMNTRFRLYFQQIICRCCCVIGRSNLRSRQMHELAGFQRSGILPSHSGHVKSLSIRWRHSNAETHVQAFKTNSRSICEKIHSRDDVAII
ncbi:tachykinin-like peptides receptor 86C isoform X2 [Leptopilina heterotoma]|uniref:tachykinin-like peptides receptor 86C isoform X2 n=1 Tax=Leptopilina heterotoma TaxID=63436 RepID=UPI001CAA264C|nr:tachykinin-like peptides receptor 86C isoform X2 [Leptopilina heterotoma]